MKFILNSLFFLLSILPLSVWSASLPPVSAKQGMVVSEQELASNIGVDILKKGGNAIDAAVAVGYALAVVNPCCGNIGGGGFMTLHLANGKNIFINFRERAPLAINEKLFRDANGNIIPEISNYGYLAVGVPGTVLGFETVLKKYGTMTRQQVMAPAIALAEKGYKLTSGDVELLGTSAKDFKKEPNVAAIFLKKENQSYQVGDRLVQKDLAKTLKLISAQGSDVFYRGPIAKKIVAESEKRGGVLSMKDFSEYRVEEFAPLYCTFHDYTVISAPPPSSGGTTLCEMLNILEKYPLKPAGFHSAQDTHYMVEAMRYAYYDRNNNLGDPDFIKNPVDLLTSKEYAAKIRQKISASKATPSEQLLDKQPTHEGVNTTHYSVIDKWGNTVAVTYTINSFFGSKVIAGDTGFLLNDEIDDFSLKSGTVNQFGLVQGDSNLIKPGKRPLSSMTPTIIMKDKEVVMALGSPGGPRIITSTVETILNALVYGMNIQEAVDAPRFHHQWFPDQISVEPYAFSADTVEKLEKMGHRFGNNDYRLSLNNTWGGVEAIHIDPQTKIIYGANDSRRPAGKAVGY